MNGLGVNRLRGRARRRCPHSRLRGIYGDEVIFNTPSFARLQCLDCGAYLDGPVSLVESRRGETS